MQTSRSPDPNPGQLQISPLFAVPFGTIQMADADALCDELRQLFLASQTDEVRDGVRRDTQVGIFESRFNLHTWPQQPVQRMFAFIHGTLAQAIQQLNQYTPEDYARLRFHYHSWFHVTQPGGHQGVHNHPMASWSGIFCVDPGDSPAERPTSGVVRFVDPKTPADMFTDPGNYNLQGVYKTGGWQLTHRRGQLVLFPSYVLHEVFPYQGTRERIVVAFNAWLTMDGATQPVRRT
jgi:uncharacterized protein (TIGR02466 family)